MEIRRQIRSEKQEQRFQAPVLLHFLVKWYRGRITRATVKAVEVFIKRMD